MKHETQAQFRNRMRAIIGLRATDKPMTNRVGSWIGFHCGDRVCDRNDPRHEATVERISSTGTVTVKYDETGWIGEIDLHDLSRILGDFTKTAKARMT